MPRPQTPLAKAALTGADKVNPGRFVHRKEPKLSNRPVGKPPAHMTPDAKKAWATFVDELGWLVYEDRAILEAASTARVLLRNPVDLPSSFWANYRMLLSSLGATPVDRQKVSSAGEEEPEDPFAAFGRAQ